MDRQGGSESRVGGDGEDDGNKGLGSRSAPKDLVLVVARVEGDRDRGRGYEGAPVEHSASVEKTVVGVC